MIRWLLEGDAAIRWQVLRDLLGATAGAVERERRKIAREGWGARLLARQDARGNWGDGLYNPKWTSTTYTMLLLSDLGLPPSNQQAQKACALLLDGVSTRSPTTCSNSRCRTEGGIAGARMAQRMPQSIRPSVCLKRCGGTNYTVDARDRNCAWRSDAPASSFSSTGSIGRIARAESSALHSSDSLSRRGGTTTSCVLSIISNL